MYVKYGVGILYTNRLSNHGDSPSLPSYLLTTSLCISLYFSGSSGVPTKGLRSRSRTPAMFTPDQTGTKWAKNNERFNKFSVQHGDALSYTHSKTAMKLLLYLYLECRHQITARFILLSTSEAEKHPYFHKLTKYKALLYLRSLHAPR